MNAKQLEPHPAATAAVRERMQAVESLAWALDALEEAAGQDDRVYLVGGAVRDLLLGRSSLDVDLVVEGHALQYARRLARVLGIDHRPHEHFQTAEIRGVTSSGREVKIDVAAARTETYAAPGALPEVAWAPLAEDLRRRDFTINAMASSLRAADRGATYAPFGAFEDLNAGVVRVIHARSFDDDPTRLLRAVRYEARLAFEIEPRTLELAREATASGLLGRLDSTRVRDELVDLLSEPTVLRALERIEQLGLAPAVHPRLRADSRVRAAIEATGGFDIDVAGARQPDRALVGLALMCHDMSSKEIETMMDRLKFIASQRDAVSEAHRKGARLGDELERAPKLAPSGLYAMLHGLRVETLLIAASRGPAARALVDTFLSRLADARLEITGDDLLAAGAKEGRAMGDALKETLALKLDGFLGSRDQELEVALRLLGVEAQHD